MYLARTSKLGDCGVYLGGVLDGHDTHQASEFCSQNFPPLLFKSIVDKAGPIQRWRRAAAGRAKLLAKKGDQLESMGHRHLVEVVPQQIIRAAPAPAPAPPAPTVRRGFVLLGFLGAAVFLLRGCAAAG